MKKPILIVMFGLLALPLLSQTFTYDFGYDEAGNRTRRTVITITDKSSDTVSVNEGISGENNPVNVLREDLFDGRSIAIYPNPTTGELILEITPLEQGISGNISIYTTNGSLLLISKELIEVNRMDLSDLLQGTYLLLITLEDKTKTYKIIKQ